MYSQNKFEETQKMILKVLLLRIKLKKTRGIRLNAFINLIDQEQKKQDKQNLRALTQVQKIQLLKKEKDEVDNIDYNNIYIQKNNMEFEAQENQGNNSIQGVINLQPQVNQVQAQQQEITIKQNDMQVSSTLEESVAVTLLRDLRQIGVKLRCVLVPTMSSNNAKELRNWDLWGPLVFCLMLAFTLSVSGNNNDGTGIFATIFVLIWIGSFVVTLNAQLLGGKVSFFQSVCVLGYCVFPINLGALFTLFFSFFYLKMFLVIGCFLWSTYSAVGFMKLLIPEQKRILALYPVILFYLFLSWFALIV